MSQVEPNVESGKEPPRRRVWVPAAAFMALWLLFSGFYDPFHIGLGVLCVGLVILINRRIPAASGDPALRPLHLLRYIVWLSWEIVKSAVSVTLLIVRPGLPIKPLLVRFQSPQPNRLAETILGNSITMTPGSLTVDLEDGHYLVHAISRESASGVLDGSMPRKVAEIFLDTPGNMMFDLKVIDEEKQPEKLEE